MSEYILTQEIISRSKSKKWDTAKLEWELIEIYPDQDSSYCLCGHYPINEICEIKNKETGEVVEVGNSCVKKFQTGMHKIIPSLKKIQRYKLNSVNPETIEYAFQNKIINDWEKEFYIDTWRKRTLTDKQMDIRVKINNKLITLLKNKK